MKGQETPRLLLMNGFQGLVIKMRIWLKKRFLSFWMIFSLATAMTACGQQTVNGQDMDQTGQESYESVAAKDVTDTVNGKTKNLDQSGRIPKSLELIPEASDLYTYNGLQFFWNKDAKKDNKSTKQSTAAYTAKSRIEDVIAVPAFRKKEQKDSELLIV